MSSYSSANYQSQNSIGPEVSNSNSAMSHNCTEVIFSDKAYNELIRESFSMDPVETGGMLLGYVVNSTWVVMEVVPPGYRNSIHHRAYFEYDQEFVNYLIPSISNSYKDPLQLLGLWHRHPGSMDYFSSTDDETNAEFAQRSNIGTLSGLVNIDPSFRLTMYHLDHFEGRRPKNVAYSRVNVEVGNNLIPEEFFALRYVDEQRSELHPTPTHTNTQISQTCTVPKSPRNGGGGNDEMVEDAATELVNRPAKKPVPNAKIKLKQKRKWLLPTAAAIIFLLGVFVGVEAVSLFDKWELTITEKVKDDKGQSDKGNKDKGKKDIGTNDDKH